ncbi:helix-turn-helix transcriptional regulator [Maribacter sp. BPC-D8]|uniref:helix-turn-helix domain-containing protein n=1 Tax=Maribacter sp. BPC-D8 TaxID=3053613 RepID=UPI002B4A22CD|nr:helix-turn-helix transcriptional regulator [Maribacter sp. BPC-D8]WRI29401.1 helix-turn-helix transcriptional regulator [Maribacter sp. BPC-D8]
MVILIYIKKSHTMHFNRLINNIKERREILNVTQETLADLSRVGLRTLKQFEKGKGNPTAKNLNKLGNTLGMELTFQIKTTTSEE